MADSGARPLAIPGTQKLFGDGGISGVAVLAGIAGVVLVLSGIKNATMAEVLRSLLQGRPIESGPSQLPTRTGGSGFGGLGQAVTDAGNAVGASASTAGPGGVSGAAVAAKAQSYVGVPYKFGFHTPAGWDCSGFVTWVLGHDFGIALPNPTHTVTSQFMVWSGAKTIRRDQCAAGDLVCWWGHIGIATGRDTMVNAPGLGIATRVQPIGAFPVPVIRRPFAYGPKATSGAG